MLLTSCAGTEGWSVDGVIEEAPQDIRLALEDYSNGRWLLVDSLTVGDDGVFAFEAAEPARYTELLRLVLPGRGGICFPADSVDDIHIHTTYDNFVAATVTGTPQAEAFTRVDSIIAAYEGHVTDAMRYELATMVTQDTTGIVSYYIVNKSIGNKRIFDPDESFGNRIYGAAANVYLTYRPDDPRGVALRNAHFQGRAALGRVPQPEENDSAATIEVNTAGVIDIDLYDNVGTRHKLSEVTGKGNVVLLDFTEYSLAQSPAYNAMLNTLYTKWHDQGFEIYQVALNRDEVEWKQVAANLPWITVWNSPSDGDNVPLSYLVAGVPTSFIIDRNGDIRERIENPDILESKLTPYFR